MFQFLVITNVSFFLCLQLAFKYLGIALFPLLGCYAVYSLMYNEHKGWYSYVLNMIYGFLLMFGKSFTFQVFQTCKSVIFLYLCLV